MDICGAAFNSKEVIVSFACLQALNSGYTTCYVTPKFQSEYTRPLLRLSKYIKRGFNILFPKEFNLSAFLSTKVEDCREDPLENFYRFRTGRFGENCDYYAIQKKFCENFKLI